MVPMVSLNYSQVIKTGKGLKLIDVERKDIFGSMNKEYINTSIIERINLFIRKYLARFKRKTLSFSKDIEMMKDSIDLSDSFQFLFWTRVIEQETLRERSGTDGHAGNGDRHHR